MRLVTQLEDLQELLGGAEVKHHVAIERMGNFIYDLRIVRNEDGATVREFTDSFLQVDDINQDLEAKVAVITADMLFLRLDKETTVTFRIVQ